VPNLVSEHDISHHATIGFSPCMWPEMIRSALAPVAAGRAYAIVCDGQTGRRVLGPLQLPAHWVQWGAGASHLCGASMSTPRRKFTLCFALRHPRISLSWSYRNRHTAGRLGSVRCVAGSHVFRNTNQPSYSRLLADRNMPSDS
jgi:hypothetical protein